MTNSLADTLADTLTDTLADTLAASGASQTNQDREEEVVLAASIAREKEEKDLILLRLAFSTMLCCMSCPILSADLT